MFSSNSYHKLQDHPSFSEPTHSSRRSLNTTAVASRLTPIPEDFKTKKIKTANLKMKVKELRNWLSDLGDKHQEHYHRFSSNDVPKLPAPARVTKDDDDDDLLGIESKPSTTSTCPSTAIVEDNDPCAFDNVVASFSSSSDDDYSSENDEAHSELYKKNGENTVTTNCFHINNKGVEHITGREHLTLLLKQAPRTHEEISFDDDSPNLPSDNDRDDVSGPSMHNSSVFRDQLLLTKATLDAMSRSPSSVRNGKKKTLGEHFEQLNIRNQHDEQHKQQLLQTCWTQDSDSDSGKAGSYEGDDEYESSKNKSNIESFGLSSASSSKDESTDIDDDATEASSIAPGVLVSKVAAVFLSQEKSKHQDCQVNPPLTKERRKRIDPKDLPFLRSSASSFSSSDTTPKTSGHQPPPTTVGKGILKFGGPRKTLVERRKEQLHTKFGENRAAVFVHKKTWGQKTPHGKYQRTTTVEKIYK